jgi:hypothetical protein
MAIDNGFAGGQNEATGHAETIDLCSGLQPAIQTRALAKEMATAYPTGVPADFRVETGGEDTPDAYRWTPTSEEDANVNIVVVWNAGYSDTDLAQDSPETSMPGRWEFQEVYGNLFGFSSAVMNFNRLPRFLVAVARSMLLIMVIF